MRSSNSRDKPSTNTYSQNRLMKTQVPPKSSVKDPKQSLNSTQYRAPPSNKRIQSSKNTTASTSSKQIPNQDLNFDIQRNMTQSKIFTAKQSLQLLKKKMNKTGMSRQKISVPAQQTNYAPDSMKKIKSETTKNIVASKNIQNYEPQYQQNNYNEQPKYAKNKYEAPNAKTKTKNSAQQKLPVRKPSPEPYYNQLEEVPISKNQNFQALLQRELKKQQNLKNMGSKMPNNSIGINKNNQNFQDDQYGEPGQLFQCSKGCGRNFNAKVLAKHQKVCQKVFLTKRKVFNTAAQRQIEVQEGFQKKATQNGNKLNQTKKSKEPEAPKNKIPKWKLQSAQLRAGVQTVNSTPLTAQQKALNEMQKDSLIPCNYCGRKFNDDAAKRHIPYCEKKAKLMPRASNGKKK